MPTQKDLKRLVRRRMQKTGESYTAARAQITRRNGDASAKTAPAPQVPPAAKVPPAPQTDYAKLAGMSDAGITKGTGHDWKHWVAQLDAVGAHAWAHRDIALHVHEKLGVPDWWSQSVTVGYERIRGLREIGQRRGGSYEASKSRTFAAPVERLFKAFTITRTRARWLPGKKVVVKTAMPGRSVRMTWDDGTAVDVWLTAKGAKSAAAIQHKKLPSRAAADASKAYWAERFDALAALLEK